MRFRSIPRLIDRLHLHASIPVDLAPLIERYEVQYQPLRSILGFAFRYDRAGLIGVNTDLHPFEQRMVIAHEAAHLTMHNRDDYYSCRRGDWWHSRMEMQAQFAASLLLVPAGRLVDNVHDGATVEELAALYEVPHDLIMVRFGLGEYAKARRR